MWEDGKEAAPRKKNVGENDSYLMRLKGLP